MFDSINNKVGFKDKKLKLDECYFVSSPIELSDNEFEELTDSNGNKSMVSNSVISTSHVNNIVVSSTPLQVGDYYLHSGIDLEDSNSEIRLSLNCLTLVNGDYIPKIPFVKNNIECFNSTFEFDSTEYTVDVAPKHKFISPYSFGESNHYLVGVKYNENGLTAEVTFNQEIPRLSVSFIDNSGNSFHIISKSGNTCVVNYRYEINGFSRFLLTEYNRTPYENLSISRCEYNFSPLLMRILGISRKDIVIGNVVSIFDSDVLVEKSPSKSNSYRSKNVTISYQNLLKNINTVNDEIKEYGFTCVIDGVYKDKSYYKSTKYSSVSSGFSGLKNDMYGYIYPTDINQSIPSVAEVFKYRYSVDAIMDKVSNLVSNLNDSSDAIELAISAIKVALETTMLNLGKDFFNQTKVDLLNGFISTYSLSLGDIDVDTISDFDVSININDSGKVIGYLEDKVSINTFYFKNLLLNDGSLVIGFETLFQILSNAYESLASSYFSSIVPSDVSSVFKGFISVINDISVYFRITGQSVFSDPNGYVPYVLSNAPFNSVILDSRYIPLESDDGDFKLKFIGMNEFGGSAYDKNTMAFNNPFLKMPALLIVPVVFTERKKVGFSTIRKRINGFCTVRFITNRYADHKPKPSTKSMSDILTSDDLAIRVLNSHAVTVSYKSPEFNDDASMLDMAIGMYGSITHEYSNNAYSEFSGIIYNGINYEKKLINVNVDSIGSYTKPVFTNGGSTLNIETNASGFEMFTRDESDLLSSITSKYDVRKKAITLLTLLKSKFGSDNVVLTSTRRTIDEQLRVVGGDTKSLLLNWSDYGFGLKIIINKDGMPITEGSDVYWSLVSFANIFERMCRNGDFGQKIDCRWLGKLRPISDIFSWEFIPDGFHHRDTLYARTRYLNGYLPYSMNDEKIIFNDVDEFVNMVNIKKLVNGTDISDYSSLEEWSMLNPITLKQLFIYYTFVGNYAYSRRLMSLMNNDLKYVIDFSNPIESLKAILGNYYDNIVIKIDGVNDGSFIKLSDGKMYISNIDKKSPNDSTNANLFGQKQLSKSGGVIRGYYDENGFFVENQARFIVTRNPVLTGYDGKLYKNEYGDICDSRNEIHLLLLNEIREKINKMSEETKNINVEVTFDNYDFRSPNGAMQFTGSSPESINYSLLENGYGVLEPQEFIDEISKTEIIDFSSITGSIKVDLFNQTIETVYDKNDDIYEKMVSTAESSGIKVVANDPVKIDEISNSTYKNISDAVIRMTSSIEDGNLI